MWLNDFLYMSTQINKDDHSPRPNLGAGGHGEETESASLEIGNKFAERLSNPFEFHVGSRDSTPQTRKFSSSAKSSVSS